MEEQEEKKRERKYNIILKISVKEKVFDIVFV